MARPRTNASTPASCDLTRSSVGIMNKNMRVGLGVLLILVGVTWTLQGLGLLQGSAMTSVTFWAIIGPIVALVGALLVAGSIRARR